jgi:rubrerythrin
MDDHRSPTGGRSRRELLVAGATAAAGGGAAALIASCGGGSSKTKSTDTVSTTEAQGDAAILNALLDQEHSSIAAYTLIATKLRGSALASVRQFIGHERRHADALGRAIGTLGGSPTPPRPDEEYASGFPRLRGERDALSFALDVETTAIAAYADALAQIATDGVRGTAAAIMVTESEHASVVLGDLGRPQVPEPFVNGPPTEADSP